jgi:hypothetical protein
MIQSASRRPSDLLSGIRALASGRRAVVAKKPEEELRILQALGTFELRPVNNNGRRGRGVLADASGYLQRVCEAPFW